MDVFLSTRTSNTASSRWVAIAVANGERTPYTGTEDQCTIQQLEIIGATRVLEALPSDRQIRFHTSSEYLVNTMRGLFRRGANHDLWDGLDNVASHFEIEWIRESQQTIYGAIGAVRDRRSLVSRDNGVGLYKVPTEDDRNEIEARLTETFGCDAREAPYSDWAYLVRSSAGRLVVTQYSNGALLIQVRVSPLFEAVCTAIEDSIDLDAGVIASRFVSSDEAEARQFAQRFSPQLLAAAEREARSAMGAAFDFLADHDRKYAVATYCLAALDVELPEYTGLVMPLSKTYEGFLRTLGGQLGLIDENQVADPDLNLGSMLQPEQWAETRTYIGNDRVRRGIFRDLYGTILTCRHFYMHSSAEPAAQIGERPEALAQIGRMSTLMNRAHRSLIET